MLKLILIRHGEEKRIKENKVNYQSNDSNLTINGIKQVKKLALKLKKFNINKIYSSDIKRALQTTKIINRELKIEIRIDKRLRERNLGDFEKFGNNWREEFNKLKEKKLNKGIPIEEIRPPNGENLYDFRNRIKSFMNDLSNIKGNILVSAHKGVNTAIINFAQNWNIREFKPIEQNYACINSLIFENGKWNVLVINDISHLTQNEI